MDIKKIYKDSAFYKMQLENAKNSVRLRGKYKDAPEKVDTVYKENTPLVYKILYTMFSKTPSTFGLMNVFRNTQIHNKLKISNKFIDDIRTLGFQTIHCNSYSEMYDRISIHNERFCIWVERDIESIDYNIRNISLYYESCDGQNIVELIEEIVDVFLDNLEIKDSEKKTISIGMVVREPHGYYVNDRSIDYDADSYKNLDLHYGSGFEKSYETVLDSLKKKKNGIVILNGTPGTGKTFTIRNIISRLSDCKNFIYVPSEFIEYVTSPEFSGFILDYVEDIKDDGKNVVLILEDAERLVMKRTGGNLSQSITNLLNSTDGLLNDILNIQVILTFNTDIKEIDEAILRSERLIGRFTFTTLPEDRKIKILESIGIVYDKEIHGELKTLSDIYAVSKGSEVIVFDNTEIKKDMIL